MNNNYNNLYCDYIGATGSYSISDYIDITSNTLNTKIDIRSNILNTKIDTTSNILKLYTDTNISNLDDKYKIVYPYESNSLITIKIDNSNSNVYINNPYNFGKIYFKNTNPLLEYVSENTRIDYDNKLYVYYNGSIIPPKPAEWWCVEEKLSSIFDANTATDFQLTGVGVALEEIYKLLGIQSVKISQLELLTLLDTTNNAAELTITNFTLASQFFVTGAAISLAASAYAVGIAAYVQSTYVDINLLNSIISNVEYTQEEKNTYADIIYSNINESAYGIYSNISNINIEAGFINSNIQTQQIIPNLYASNILSSNISTSNLSSSNISSLNLKTSNLLSSNISSLNLYTCNIYVNSGNINGIDINNLKTSGNIIENGLSLSSKYLTSNHIYNLSNNYTTERQYPSKLYTITQQETTKELLGELRYYTNIYLDSQSISYGSGYYDIYSSSTYENYINSKDNLFNFNTADTTARAIWEISQYSSGTGEYLGVDNINGYYGDWVIIKMPTEISLSRYRIYQFTDTPTKAPSKWKIYGSKDGINFTEIIEASQTSRLTSYTNNYYEKTITGISPLYSYIAFVFSALLSTSGQTELSFAELQIFGKELLNQSIISNVYTTSNAVKNIVEFEMPIVAKHYGFYITITTSININGTTYYKYDIDLRKYTQLGVIQIGPQSGDTFRSFKIRVMYATMFFSYIIKDLPNVCYYEVFMSYKNTAVPPNGAAGLNACAIGFPPNTTLQNIIPNNLFVIKNGMGSIDYITVISTNAADCRVIIEDLLG